MLCLWIDSSVVPYGTLPFSGLATRQSSAPSGRAAGRSAYRATLRRASRRWAVNCDDSHCTTGVPAPLAFSAPPRLRGEILLFPWRHDRSTFPPAEQRSNNPSPPRLLGSFRLRLLKLFRQIRFVQAFQVLDNGLVLRVVCRFNVCQEVDQLAAFLR